MKQSCPICVQDMNKTTRLAIECPDPQCGFTCCRTCMKEYIVTQRHDPKCMDCSKAFSRMFLHTILPTTWIKTAFKDERESILLDREKSMIPDTMPWVDAEATSRDLEKDIGELAQKYNELKLQTDQVLHEMAARRQTIHRLRDGDVSDKKRTPLVVKCPGCPAFVNKLGKCTGCGGRICMHCRDTLEVVGGAAMTVDDIVIIKPVAEGAEGAEGADGVDDRGREVVREEGVQYHECDKEMLASALMIRNDTKPCPKCGTPIHKIEGCDQMFDPQCGTAFSWKSGKVVTGVIHNPHYFQWQREHGAVARQPGDILCGGAPGQADMGLVLGWIPSRSDFARHVGGGGIVYGDSSNQTCDKNISCCNDLARRWGLVSSGRILTHIQQVELNQLQTVWDQTTNRSMRVKYIMKDIDEDTFKGGLAQKERMMEKDREIQQVFDTFLQAGSDILRKFVAQFVDFNHIAPAVAGDKKGIKIADLMGYDAVGMKHPWWCNYRNGTVMYRRRNVDIDHMSVPSREIVKVAYDEISQLENYCNGEFAKISVAWKLVAPQISIDGDKIFQKRWRNIAEWDATQ